MGNFIFDNVPESLIEEINDRFRMFQINETVLPSWCIRFHSFIPSETDLRHYYVGNVGNHYFYKIQNSFFIFRHFNNRHIAVECPMDFSEANIYCDNYSGDKLLCADLFEVMRESFRYYALRKQALLLHSSAVSYNNEAIAFFGFSGAGKSTQAEFWNKTLGAEVLNYDQNYLFTIESRFYTSSTPWGGKEKYYINRVTPLKAVIMVQKSLGVFENKVVRVGTADAFSLLYSHNFIFPLDKEIEDSFYNVIEKIVTTVPVYMLYCSYGEEPVKLLYKELYRN